MNSLMNFSVKPLNPVTQLSLKVALASAIGCVIFLYFQNTFGFLLILAPLIAVSSSIGGSKKQACLALTGVALGCLFGLIAVSTLINQHIALALLFAGWILLIGYLMKYPALAMSALLAGAFSITIADTALYNQSLAVSYFFSIIGCLALGLFIFQVINYTLWPTYAYKQIRAALIKTLELEQALVESILTNLTGDQQAKLRIQDLEKLVRQQLQINHKLLTEAGYELKHKQVVTDYIAQYYFAVDSIFFSLLKLADYTHQTNLKVSFFTDNQKVLQQGFDQLFSELSTNITHNTQVTEAEINLTQRIKQLSGSLATYAEQNNLSKDEQSAIQVCLHLFKSLLIDCAGLNSLIKQLNQQQLTQPDTDKGQFITQLKRLLASTSFDPHQFFFSAKLLIALAILFFIQQYFAWSSAVSAMVTAIFVLGPTHGKTMQTSLWRASGSLSGCALGFIFLLILEHFPSTWLLVLGITLLIYFCTELTSKGPAQANIGIQIALATTLVLLPNPYFSGSVETGFLRFMGVITGAVVAALVSITFLPRRATSEYHSHLAHLLAHTKDLFNLVFVIQPNQPISKTALQHNLVTARQYASQYPTLLGQMVYEKASQDDQQFCIDLANSLRSLYLNAICLVNLANQACYETGYLRLNKEIIFSSNIDKWFTAAYQKLASSKRTATLPVINLEDIKAELADYFHKVTSELNTTAHLPGLKHSLASFYGIIAEIDQRLRIK
jgi:uncharacterized membrane protein YccC